MDRIVLFKTYYNPIEASIVKERLIANGIPCFLSDEHTITVNPLYNQALGGVKLRMFDRDVESAKSILQDEDVQIHLDEIIEGETGGASFAEVENKACCPVCGSDNMGYVQATKRRFSVFTIIVSFLLMVYPFSTKKTYHCFNCEHEF